MPIALPPPSAPQQGVVETIRSQGSEIVTASFQQTQVHVLGPEGLPKDAIQAAITSADTMSNAVRQIEGAVYVAGYPAVQITYALSGSDLYVLVSLGKIARVDAPAPYDAYFSGLAGADPLTDNQLEPARTLASLHADRAGDKAEPVFKPEQDGVAMVISPKDGPKPVGVGLEFGNPGNRYVGRYFLDWFARASDTHGDEVKATGRNGLTGLNNESGADEYNEHSLSVSRVTPIGIFGASGRYVSFVKTQDVDALPTSLDGEIRQGEIGWLGLLAASFDTRWTVGAKGDYTRKDFAVRHAGPLLQRQEYASAELSTDYSSAARYNGIRFDFDAGVAVRKGFGHDDTDEATRLADQGYLLVRPSLAASTTFADRFTVGLTAVGQLTKDTLPEQQQWVVGGLGNVEAYVPGVVIGDNGGTARLQGEMRLGDVAGFEVTPRVFAEYGYAKFKHEIADQANPSQSLADVGIGLLFRYGTHIEAAVSYSEPLSDHKVSSDVRDDADANVFFRLTIKS